MEDLPNGQEPKGSQINNFFKRLPFRDWWNGLVRSWERWRERRPEPRPKPPAVDEEEIARWITLLAHPSDPDHTRAMDELVVIGNPAIPALIAALQGDTWIQTFRASEALGLIGSRRAIRPLLRLLDHPNSNVRWGATEALGRIQSRWARGRLRRTASEDENRTTWGETVAEAAERAVASIDRTWFSRLISVFQVLLLLAACVAIVFVTVQIIQTELERRVTPAPTETSIPTAAPTQTSTPTPSPTLLPEFPPIAGTITGQTANVREMPNGDQIGTLHYGDEILIYGGQVDDNGDWWYLMRLTRINNPATSSGILEAGAYGWLHASLVAGVEDLQVVPTVAAIETMRAQEATPTTIGSSLELGTPTPITATVTP